jgi:hypothetical protein
VNHWYIAVPTIVGLCAAWWAFWLFMEWMDKR